MARCVYVSPLSLIGGMYADLQGANPESEQFDMFLTKVENEAVNGFKVDMLFECASTLVPGGQVRLEVEGLTQAGGVEAERSCMMRMIEAMRVQYQMFPADFNFLMISEKRDLFTAMRNVIDPARADYLEMAGWLGDCYAEVAVLCDRFSVWIGNHHPYVDFADRSAVASCQAILKKVADTVAAEMRHSRRLCDIVPHRNSPPAGLAMFDATVPAHMNINWEGSYHTLLIVYKSALKKLRGVASTIRLHRLVGGQYKAYVDVSVEPHVFSGDVCDSQRGALAKLFFVVIKHVNVDLRHCILDFHSDIKDHIYGYVDRFNASIDQIIRCGEKLEMLCRLISGAFDECVADLAARLEINEETEGVLQSVHEVSGLLEARKAHIQAKWNVLSARRTDRATLEAAVAGNA